MTNEVKDKRGIEKQGESVTFNPGNLSIRPAQQVDNDFLMSLLNEMQEMLKDVKTSLSEDIINERNR